MLSINEFISIFSKLRSILNVGFSTPAFKGFNSRGSIPSENQINLDLKLKWEEKEKVFDPVEVYGNTPNPTKL